MPRGYHDLHSILVVPLEEIDQILRGVDRKITRR